MGRPATGCLCDEKDFAVRVAVFGEVLRFAGFLEAKCFCNGDGEFAAGDIVG